MWVCSVKCVCCGVFCELNLCVWCSRSEKVKSMCDVIVVTNMHTDRDWGIEKKCAIFWMLMTTGRYKRQIWNTWRQQKFYVALQQAHVFLFHLIQKLWNPINLLFIFLWSHFRSLSPHFVMYLHFSLRFKSLLLYIQNRSN